MTREGQPRGRQQPNKPLWETDPRFTPAMRASLNAELQAWRAKADQIMNAYFQAEAAKTIPPKPLEINGKFYTGAEAWEAFYAEQKRKEAIRPAPQVPEQLPPRTLSKNEGKGKAVSMFRALAQEVTDRQFEQAGRILRKEVWGVQPDNRQVTVKKCGDMDVAMNRKTGEVADRSQVGVALADQANGRELYYGIGYFGSTEKFLPYATGSISPEMLKKGVKAYFIEWTYTQDGKEKRELLLIPFTYAYATSEFFTRLHHAAVYLASPQIRHRRQAPQQLAA